KKRRTGHFLEIIQARDRIDTLIEQLEVESKRQQSHIFQLHGCTKQMENSQNLGLNHACDVKRTFLTFLFLFMVLY
ncbi:hypothetical protein ACJX0J_032582, partial [Zea mays]